MRRSRASTDHADARGGVRGALAGEDGSASLEFIVGGVLLLVPIVYLMLALGTIQAQSLGVEAAARHTARAISTATDATDAAGRAERVLASVIDEYGLDPDGVQFGWTCTDAAGDCPSAGSSLVVTVAARVPLPFMPPVFDLDRIAAVPVEASAVQKVSRFWVGGP